MNNEWTRKLANNDSFRLAAVATLILGTLQPLAAATTVSATTLRRVVAVRETVATTTSSTVWVNVPGATATFTVPPLMLDVFLARFTAESACYGATGWCSVRILLNGVEMAPAAASDFAFDSSDGNTETAASWESHAIERSQTYQTSTLAIPVTLQVQYMVTNPAMTFRLDDWHFAVEQLH